LRCMGRLGCARAALFPIKMQRKIGAMPFKRVRPQSKRVTAIGTTLSEVAYHLVCTIGTETMCDETGALGPEWLEAMPEAQEKLSDIVRRSAPRVKDQREALSNAIGNASVAVMSAEYDLLARREALTALEVLYNTYASPKIVKGK